MPIQWNKVTWYSKTLALLLLIILPIGAFWFGKEIGKTLASAYVSDNVVTHPGTGLDPYYTDTTSWPQDNVTEGNFTIKYPIDFYAGSGCGKTPTDAWRQYSDGTKGCKGFTLTVPRAFQPQTNLAEATFTVGWSSDAKAADECLGPTPNSGEKESGTEQIDGIQFKKFSTSEGAAGNFYTTESYRAQRNNRCYAVESTIHSTNIQNYPAEYKLKPYNQQQIETLFDTIINTINFAQ